MATPQPRVRSRLDRGVRRALILERRSASLAMVSTVGAAFSSGWTSRPECPLSGNRFRRDRRIYASTWLWSGIAALRQFCRNP